MADFLKQDGVKLRRYFQKVAEMETKIPANAAYLEIKCHLSGDRNNARVSEIFLAFIKDGEVVAMAPIAKKDFKRLKGDFEFMDGPLRSRSGQRAHA